MEGKIFNHESYGMVDIYRTQSNKGKNLFGSSIKHSNTICIRVHKAEVKRHLHQERFFAKDRSVVEIELSADQFSQFITTSNTGDGVPCTIRRINGKQIEDPPYYGINEMYHEEIKEDIKKSMNDSNELANKARQILLKKGTISISERKELNSMIEMLSQHINDNITFVHKQFCRTMDKTITAAKAEIESFYTSTIMKMGKKALDSGMSPDLPQIEE